jgi:AcrR family transcriptional regulator
VLCVSDEQDLGLRERKKLHTRAALSRAALRLALEHGLENVRVDDIAAEAGVSRRTFANYFSNKEEAIAALTVERAVRTAEALRNRPTDEPLAEALAEVFANQYDGPPRQFGNDLARIRLLISSPSLRGEYLKTLAAAERPLAEAIAERTGTDVEHDLFPRALAAATSSAARVAMNHWAVRGGTKTLSALMRQAITQVLAGHPAFAGQSSDDPVQAKPSRGPVR